MEFDDLSKVHLYRYKNRGPFMFSMSGVNDDGENFAQSNGEFGGDKMPVIFWPDDTRTLRFSTKITEPDSTTVSMLDRSDYGKGDSKNGCTNDHIFFLSFLFLMERRFGTERPQTLPLLENV